MFLLHHPSITQAPSAMMTRARSCRAAYAQSVQPVRSLGPLMHHTRAFCGRCEDACEHHIGSVLLYVAAKRRKLSSPVNAVITCMGKHDSSPTQSSPEMATPVSDSDDTKTAQDRLREKREEAAALVQSETDVMSLWGLFSIQSAFAPLPPCLCAAEG